MTSRGFCVSLLRMLAVYLLVVQVIIAAAQDIVGYQAAPRQLIAEFPEATEQFFTTLMANLGLRAGIAVVAILIYIVAGPLGTRISRGLDLPATPPTNAA